MLTALQHTTVLYAADATPAYIQVTLGDYNYMPHEIKLCAGKHVVLQLINTDLITPHNTTLRYPAFGLDIDVDTAAGKNIEVKLNPLWPTILAFYCNKRLPLLTNHLDKGMEGNLIVEPSE